MGRDNREARQRAKQCLTCVPGRTSVVTGDGETLRASYLGGGPLQLQRNHSTTAGSRKGNPKP